MTADRRVGTPAPDVARATEAARQRALLAALWPAAAGTDSAPAAIDALATHLDAAARVTAARGVQAYRVNAGAAAERALAAAFPVLRALVGADDFGALARAYWQARPPVRGDLAWLGESLPGFLADDPQLRDVPYLADVARLERAVARAEAAADPDPAPEAGLASLARLGDTDPAALWLVMAPGSALVASPWPVASLWNAHVRDPADAAADPDAPLVADPAALAAVRERLVAGHGECALAWRAGWRVRVREADAAEAAFLEAALRGADLSSALDAGLAAGAFAFDAWLARAVSDGVLVGVAGEPPPDPAA